MNGNRKPTSFLNYRGDLLASFDMSRAYGPNTLGEALWPVTIELSLDPELTRVGFSLIAPPEVSA